MSEKRLDAKNRWRNVVVAFRMSPEEAQELNVKVSLSGLSKQDYIIQCLLKHEIRVVGGMKMAKKVQVHASGGRDAAHSAGGFAHNLRKEVRGMRLTMHIGSFTVTITVKKRGNRHSGK